MRHLTIRQVPDDLARVLDLVRRSRGVSMNQLVIDLLRQATGAVPNGRYDNGLGSFAGTWTEADLAEFEAATAASREIDEEVWR